MVKTKLTIKSIDNKTYVSVDIESQGHNDDSYSATDIYKKLLRENFPGWKGTQLEWIDMLQTAQEIKIQNLGKVNEI